MGQIKTCKESRLVSSNAIWMTVNLVNNFLYCKVLVLLYIKVKINILSYPKDAVVQKQVKSDPFLNKRIRLGILSRPHKFVGVR